MRTAEAVAAMPCPICRTGLTLSDRSGVEIDYCQTCRGVWLDRGELDKILERSSVEVAPARRQVTPRMPGYGSEGYRDDDHRYRHGKRKKSFLSELFD
jgi:uncharacterized protein